MPERWLSAVSRRGEGLNVFEPVTRDEQASEYLVMALRLAEGIDRGRYAALGGRVAAERLAMLQSEGLIALDAASLRATAKGRLVLNAVAAELRGD